MPSIITKNGEYVFKEISLEVGTKIIDREISKNNLLLLKDILDDGGVKFILAYGTLLGAIREHNFIAHDEDIDIIVLKEDKELFLNVLFKLRDVGLEVIRDVNDLISVMKDGEYIDIYFFKKGLNGQRKNGKFRTKSTFLENTKKYEFFGLDFDIPEDHIGYLEYNYGKDWNIPKKNAHAYTIGYYGQMRDIFRNLFPRVYKVLNQKYESFKSK